MSTLAGLVADAMARKGLTQQRLAEQTGLTAPWVNMIVRRGKHPGPEALIKIADALDLDRRMLIRQAHIERAYNEWRPYLDENPEEKLAGPGFVALAVIGITSAGADGVEVDLVKAPRRAGQAAAADAPGNYMRPPKAEGGRAVGFHPECKAIRVRGDGLEPVAYDGQYVVISPVVKKEDIPDGSIVYVTYELPEDGRLRAMIKRMYRYRLAGDESGAPGLPIYNFVPVNSRLRRKGHAPEPVEAVTLRHRQVREMYPVVGVIFANMIERAETQADANGRN